MDSIALLTPHAKLAVRPPSANVIPKFIKDAYRAAYFGRPGPAFVDLPADLILGKYDIGRQKLVPLNEAPISMPPAKKLQDVANAIKQAKAPLLVLGKGAAYGRAEGTIRALVERQVQTIEMRPQDLYLTSHDSSTQIPFVPTPMGKGIVPDSSPYNYSAARSTAFKEADVVLVLGARLNWILAFGLPPKWSATVKIIQVDVCADELGKNGGDAALSMFGDVGATVEGLLSHLGNWQWQGQSSSFLRSLETAQSRNREKAARKAAVRKSPMVFEQAFDVIKATLDSLSTPADGDIVYVSEGANAMDISRSIFTMEHPRTRLDAGTYATMGVGLGYAVAAYAAYNFPRPEGVAGKPGRKKIVCIEGDSAFGFSGMEVETMARYQMDVLIFVMNNNGLYRGDTDSADTHRERQRNTVAGTTTEGKGLTAWSLGYQTNYQKMAEMAGGLGFEARTPEELKNATEKAYHARVPVVINVIINSQSDLPMVSAGQICNSKISADQSPGLLVA